MYEFGTEFTAMKDDGLAPVGTTTYVDRKSRLRTQELATQEST